MFKFQKLAVWEKSIQWTDGLLEVADSLPQRYQFSFGEQLRRAGISVPTNIAEGTGRYFSKESAHFFTIAKGSVYECVNLIIMIARKNLLNQKFSESAIIEKGEELSKMLSGLIDRNYHQ